MDEPTTAYAALDADPSETLRKVAAYADSHGLGDASLISQFGAYLRAAQIRCDRSLADRDDLYRHHD
jgi:hypothetical protein